LDRTRFIPAGDLLWIAYGVVRADPAIIAANVVTAALIGLLPH
jgi:hypothetical protein